MKSNIICQNILASLDRGYAPIMNFKRMKVGQIVQLKGKIGKILAFAWINRKMCVWLEITITRGKSVHFGMII